jgi:hypothetical protein
VGTGLIVAFVVTVWAAYFVPLALRRYDEAHEQSALETLSPLSRVIRRAPSAAELAAAADEVDDAEPVERTESTPERAPQAGFTRESARVAARRRRRVLITLIFANAIVGGLAGPGYAVIPLWSIAIPATLLVAWLVACRIQVRREYGIAANGSASEPKQLKVKALKEPKQAKKTKSAKTSKRGSSAADGEDTVQVFLGDNAEDLDAGRKHVMEDAPLEVDALEEQLVIAVPSAASHGEMVWDPLPVTLPTYVTKPRAGRTVRTIDFNAPGVWTSGHVEGEELELPLSEVADDASAADAQRHAAGQ